MIYHTVFIRKGGQEVTQCFDSVFDAIEWLKTGFIASQDDSANIGVEYAIRTDETTTKMP